MNHRLIHKGKARLWAVYANMPLSGSWNAFWPGLSEISKWTWRTVSEEITTKELPMCGGDLHWGTAGPFCYTWVSSQTGFQTLFGKASGKPVIVTSWDVYCRAEQEEEEEVGRRRQRVSSSVEPRDTTVARKITWPESRMRGDLSERFEVWAPFIQMTLCFCV